MRIILSLIILFACSTPQRNLSMSIKAQGLTKSSQSNYSWYESLKPASSSYIPVYKCQFEKTHNITLSDLNPNSKNNDLIAILLNPMSPSYKNIFNPSLRTRLDRVFPFFDRDNLKFSHYFSENDLCRTDPYFPKWWGACHSVALSMSNRKTQERLFENQGAICKIKSDSDQIIGFLPGELTELTYLLRQKDFKNSDFTEIELGISGQQIKESLRENLALFHEFHIPLKDFELEPEYFYLLRDWKSYSSVYFTRSQKNTMQTAIKNPKQFPAFNNSEKYIDESNLNAKNFYQFLLHFYGPESDPRQQGLIMESSVDDSVFNYFIHKIEISSQEAIPGIKPETILASIHNIQKALCNTNDQTESCEQIEKIITIEESYLLRLQAKAKEYYKVGEKAEKLYIKDRLITEQYLKEQLDNVEYLSRLSEFALMYSNIQTKSVTIDFYYQHFSSFSQGTLPKAQSWITPPDFKNHMKIKMEILVNKSGAILPLDGRFVESENELYVDEGKTTKTFTTPGLNADWFWIPGTNEIKESSLSENFWSLLSNKSNCVPINQLVNLQKIVDGFDSASKISAVDLVNSKDTLRQVIGMKFIKDSAQTKASLQSFLSEKLRNKKIIKEFNPSSIEDQFLKVEDLIP